MKKEGNKSKKADDQEGNKGVSLQERKQRYKITKTCSFYDRFAPDLVTFYYKWNI